MSRGRTNELEERRVIRLLHGVADDVEPLPAGEVAQVLQAANLGVARGRSRRRAGVHVRDLLAAAAAAAVILGTTLAASVPGSQQASSGAVTAHGELAVFPEGSALQLLLAGGTS